MTPMPQTIAEMIRGDYERRRWTFRQAGPLLDTTPQTVQRWKDGKAIPERRHALKLATFLERDEKEILAAMDEAEREARARKDLQDQIKLMRQEQADMNNEISELRDMINEMLDEVRRRQSPTDGD